VRAGPVVVSTIVLVVAIALGLSVGTSDISVVHALLDASSNDRTVVMDLRLPRVLLGVVAGGGLAAVGVAFQAVLRNPLAEPYVLGVSGGAALGATIVIACGVAATSVLGAEVLPLAALATGLGATALVYALARRGPESGTSILLAGVVVNAMASAAITFLKTLVPERIAQDILFWLVGFLDTPASRATLPLMTVYVTIGVLLLLRDAGRLNLLALGSEEAGHLGLNVTALERRTLIGCSLVVGAIVSVTGLIGFVGLIVPHALRRLVGPDVRVLLPASIPAGGAALVACDAVSRLLFHALHTTPPVGAVTALIGGPLFLVLLRRRAAS
jgi:iron complex transport system permease protein